MQVNLRDILIISILFNLTFCLIPPGCLCNMDKRNFGKTESVSTGLGLLSVSPIDHFQEQKNYGKLVAVNGLIFTQKNFTVKDRTNSLELMKGESCPEGFRPLTKADLDIINQTLKGSNFWMVKDHDHLNIPVNTYMLSSVKVYPLDFSQNPSAMDFYGVRILPEDEELNIEKYTTSKTDLKKITKCVMESYQSNRGRNMKEDLMQKMEYDRNILSDNILDYYVELTGGIQFENVGIFHFVPKFPGCFYIKIKKKMWDGTIVTNCEAYMVQHEFGSAFNTFLINNKLKKTKYETDTLLREDKMHFRGASAPMAAKPEGGAYVLYSFEKDKRLEVMELDNQLKEKKIFNLKMKGRPMAIACTDSGFVIYIQDGDDKHKSKVASFSTHGELRWFKILMNNGDKPKENRDQIMFHDEKGKIVFGMEAMYRPDSGRLAVGRNRIVLIFSHYNNFKAGLEGQELDSHTGDTTISMDLNGRNLLLGRAWGTTHSLSQRLVYDGLNFLTASLGDAFPQGVRFTVNDGKHRSRFIDGKTGRQNRYSTSSSSNVIPGEIPGDGQGRSCGRLGGLHVIRDNKFRKYAQVYSRRPCTSGLDGVKSTNDKDEIGVVFFDRELKLQSKHVIGQGWSVNGLRSALYGRNILVMYSTTNRNDNASPEFLPNTFSENDSCYMMLVRPNGSIKSKAVKLENCVIGTDDFVTLQDGNVAWTYVDAQGKISTFRLTSPIFESLDSNYLEDEIQEFENEENYGNAETGGGVKDDDGQDSADDSKNDEDTPAEYGGSDSKNCNLLSFVGVGILLLLSR